MQIVSLNNCFKWVLKKKKRRRFYDVCGINAEGERDGRCVECR